MEILVFAASFAIVAAASRQIGQNLVKTGLPMISGFLFTGIIAGPHVLGLISKEACLSLQFVDEFSLGYIAFAAGGELYLKELRNRLKAIAWVTVCLVGTTFTLTSVTMFLLAGFIPFMHSMPVAARIVEKLEAKKLELNDIAKCTLFLDRQIAVDAYDKNRYTGSFIVIDRYTNETLGAGMIIKSIQSSNEESEIKEYTNAEKALNQYIRENFPEWECKEI